MILAKLVLCFVVIFVVPADAQSRRFRLNVIEYLRQYHYLGDGNPDPEIREIAETNMPMAVEFGIRMFQMKWNLPVTGTVDAATRRMMNQPRCGCSDIDVMEEMPEAMDTILGRARERVRQVADGYMLQGSKWDRDQITYRISQYTPDLPQREVDEEIRKAFQMWSEVTPLDFIQVYSAQVDIDIRFAPISHGDGFDFDGSGGTLAHAFFPQYGGATHFDESELWTIDTYAGINLLQVAAHEFGHALGLRHSEKLGALMYPFYQGYAPDYTLPQDDRDGIQAIYGARNGRPTESPVTYPPRPDPTPFIPDKCDEFDAITTQVIDGVHITYVFNGNHYLQINPRGIETGYPRRISDDWLGVDFVDAALTMEYEQHNGRWHYRRVTYLFAGDKYYQFIEKMKVGEGYIDDDWNLPSYIDAIFQYSGDGKIYAIKDQTVYTIHSRSTHLADPAFQHSIREWGLSNVNGAFMGINDRGKRDTFLFDDDQYYKIDDYRRQVAPGYPKRVPERWLGCDGDFSHLLYLNINRV